MKVEILRSDDALTSVAVFDAQGGRVASLEVYAEGNEVFASSKQSGRVSLSRPVESATARAYRDAVACIERKMKQLETAVLAARFG